MNPPGHHGQNHPRLKVIGVGNPYRGDDAAGVLVVRRLAAGRCPPGTEIIEHTGEPAGLLAAWAHADVVWLIDAAVFDAPPGTVHHAVITASHGSPAEILPPGLRGTSTHALGVADAVELAGVLGLLPPLLVIYAIRAADLTTGAVPSPPVDVAISRVTSLVESETRREGAGRVGDADCRLAGDGGDARGDQVTRSPGHQVTRSQNHGCREPRANGAGRNLHGR
ncbi:hydrogenase maturation protease [Parafrankia elaeagni]|uniref:hydrogenase maturation protease n=1 Tax=Parafrankia elaeagni TaxID=222534 RepID=UPI000363969C|nr:hydrogenase maturation protease [Parafrankia elaeagni]